MKVKHILTSVFCFLILHQYTQAQNISLSWVRKVDNEGIFRLAFTDEDIVSRTAVDIQGNVYIMSQHTVPSGSQNRYTDVVKYNALGEVLWKKRVGRFNGQSIVVDKSSNVYLTGSFNIVTGTDFDPGDSVYNLSSKGVNDVFIQKLDSMGNFVWAKSFGSATGHDYGFSIYLDTKENIYVTGAFKGIVDFDPGDSVYNISSSNQDIFIQKLDSSGNFIWAKSIGSGSNGDNGSDIFVDSKGSIYITGYFTGTVDFDLSDSVYNLSSNGQYDIFIQKLDSSGDFVWAKSWGTTSYDEGHSVCVDEDENVYVVGHFTGSINFDTEDTIYSLSSKGNRDGFVQKLDKYGNIIWVKHIGTAGIDVVTDVLVDNNYGVYITGYFAGVVNFDPGDSVYTVSSKGNRDVFIQKLDSAGNFIWARTVGGNRDDFGYSVGLSEDCGVYFSGLFETSIGFNESGIDTTYTTDGNYYLNTFIAKYTQDYTAYTTVSDTVFACDSYVFQDSTYVSPTELYTDTLCGVITKHYVSILQSIETMDTVSACVHFVWGDSTYRYTGVYQDTLYRTNTCDSVVELSLSIHSPSTGDTTLVSCDSVHFAGTVYTVSGMYQDTLIGWDINGCDSILSIALTIIDSVDTVVMQEDSRLVARLEGAEYQWLDCGNSYIEIEGATNRIFTANTNGEYAVEITDVCIDTSSCYTIMGLSISKSIIGFTQMNVYPSPTEGEMFIELGQFSERVFVVVRDVFGRVLQDVVYDDVMRINTRLETSAGMYYIEVSDDKGNRGVFRVVKQ